MWTWARSLFYLLIQLVLTNQQQRHTADCDSRSLSLMVTLKETALVLMERTWTEGKCVLYLRVTRIYWVYARRYFCVLRKRLRDHHTIYMIYKSRNFRVFNRFTTCTIFQDYILEHTLIISICLKVFISLIRVFVVCYVYVWKEHS